MDQLKPWEFCFISDIQQFEDIFSLFKRNVEILKVYPNYIPQYAYMFKKHAKTFRENAK